MNFLQIDAGTGLVAWAILSIIAHGAFVWAWGTGQFHDLDRASRLPLEDGEVEPEEDNPS